MRLMAIDLAAGSVSRTGIVLAPADSRSGLEPISSSSVMKL
jgi:hypothetical protein